MYHDIKIMPEWGPETRGRRESCTGTDCKQDAYHAGRHSCRSVCKGESQDDASNCFSVCGRRT